MSDKHSRHLADNVHDPACGHCMTLQRWIDKWNAFVADSEEADWFLSVNHLAPGAMPKVWFRYFGPDFMAGVSVTRKGGKRPRRLTAVGTSIQGALENLAHEVAEYLYPSEKRKQAVAKETRP